MTDKELDEIEARLATLTTYSATAIGQQPYLLKLLADAVTLLAEVRRLRQGGGAFGSTVHYPLG